MLSLCLIARDEEQLIGQCLDSVRDLVDEMIVLDTGSTDATPTIAAARGAKVYHFHWNDDFAAARNAALAEATGDWILVLDADEVLTESGMAVIRDTIDKDQIRVGMLPLFNAASLDASHEAVLSGKSRLGEPVRLARLLKRTPGLCWTGMFHEHVGDWVIAEGLKVASVDAAIIHYGNVPQLREDRDKEGRNARLLKSYCEKEPGNLRALCNYLKVLMRTGSPDEIRKIADQAWGLLQSQAAAGEKLDPFAVTMAGCQRAEFLKGQGEIDEALHTLKLALQWGIRDSCLYLIQGTVLEQAAMQLKGRARLALLVQARDSYSSCLSFQGQISALDNYPGATSWAAYLRLGHTCLKMSDNAEAEQYFAKALESLPDLKMDHITKAALDANVGRIVALTDAGRGEEAALLARKKVSEFKGPDLWALAADAAEHTGDFSTMMALARRCASHLKKVPFATYLARDRYADVCALIQLYQGAAVATENLLGLFSGLIRQEQGLRDCDQITPAEVERFKRILTFIKQERPDDYAKALAWGSSYAPFFSGMIGLT